MSKSLIPKKIVDKNGKVTTVHVRPDANASTASAPNVAPLSQSESLSRQIERFTLHESEAAAYAALTQAKPGEDIALRFNEPLPSGGKVRLVLQGDGYAYDHFVNPGIERENGDIVIPYDDDTATEVTSIEGTVHQQWFTPIITSDPNVPEASFTDQEYSELEELHERYFEDTFEESVERWSPTENLQESVAKLIILDSRKYGGIELL